VVFDFAFIRNRYDFELTRKESLTAATSAAGFFYVIDQVRFVMPVQPNPTPSLPASAPQKPSFPPNRVIKEGRRPQTTTRK
jgi:hypothetical protein